MLVLIKDAILVCGCPVTTCKVNHLLHKRDIFKSPFVLLQNLKENILHIYIFTHKVIKTHADVLWLQWAKMTDIL